MAQFNQNVDSTKDNGEWQNREFYPNITVSLEDTVSGGWDY
jgi:hypothetical protein